MAGKSKAKGSEKADLASAKTKDAAKKYEYTPDMMGKVRSTGAEMRDSDPEEILKIISQNPILAKYIGFFENLSDEELRSIVADATEFAVKKMEEME